MALNSAKILSNSVLDIKILSEPWLLKMVLKLLDVVVDDEDADDVDDDDEDDDEDTEGGEATAWVSGIIVEVLRILVGSCNWIEVFCVWLIVKFLQYSNKLFQDKCLFVIVHV